MSGDGQDPPSPFPLNAEQMESVRAFLQQITENPSLLQEPQCDSLRRFLATVQANPEQFPLLKEEEENEQVEDEIGVCYCPEKRRPHTEACQELQPLKKRVRDQEKILQEAGLTGTLHVDPFGDDDRAQNYLDSLYEMAERLFDLGMTAQDDDGPDSKNAERFFNASLQHFLVHMSRSPARDLDGCMALDHVASILLELGRYDDLYAFVEFFLKRQTFTNDHRQIAQSGKFFLTAKVGCAEKNVCGEFSQEELQSRSACVLPFLVILFLMKIRMLKAREEWKDSLQVFLNTSEGKRIRVVSSLLQLLVFPTQPHAQLETLMGAIHKRNPSILPALVFPDPLVERNQDFMEGGLYFPRCPLEALNVLRHCEHSFRSTDGARNLLVQRFGERPRYHHEPFDYTAEEVGFQEDGQANEEANGNAVQP